MKTERNDRSALEKLDARLKTLLPEEYRDSYEEMQPKPMGSAALKYDGEGLVAWIGLLVVVQNIFTSLFNSHLFDFHEGWMYVLGVGVAGGTVLRARSRPRPPGP